MRTKGCIRVVLGFAGKRNTTYEDLISLSNVKRTAGEHSADGAIRSGTRLSAL